MKIKEPLPKSPSKKRPAPKKAKASKSPAPEKESKVAKLCESQTSALDIIATQSSYSSTAINLGIANSKCDELDASDDSRLTNN